MYHIIISVMKTLISRKIKGYNTKIERMKYYFDKLGIFHFITGLKRSINK